MEDVKLQVESYVQKIDWSRRWYVLNGWFMSKMIFITGKWYEMIGHEQGLLEWLKPIEYFLSLPTHEANREVTVLRNSWIWISYKKTMWFITRGYYPSKDSTAWFYYFFSTKMAKWEVNHFKHCLWKSIAQDVHDKSDQYCCTLRPYRQRELSLLLRFIEMIKSKNSNLYKTVWAEARNVMVWILQSLWVPVELWVPCVWVIAAHPSVEPNKHSWRLNTFQFMMSCMTRMRWRKSIDRIAQPFEVRNQKPSSYITIWWNYSHLWKNEDWDIWSYLIATKKHTLSKIDIKLKLKRILSQRCCLCNLRKK